MFIEELGGKVDGIDGCSMVFKLFVWQAKCGKYSIGSSLLGLESDFVDCQIDR